MAQQGTRLGNLKQAPLNTTMMGVLKAAADFCARIKSDYLKIAGNLEKASNKAMDRAEKVALRKATKEFEAAAIGNVAKLADRLR